MPLTFDEFKSQYDFRFTPQQERAVQSVDGPVLVLAVPGAGKTTVLIARLGFMILCRGIAPEQILTLTYTVAATKDMRRRFTERFGPALAERLEFRTINGICARIIASYGRQIGRTPFTLQTNEGDILCILRELCIELAHRYPTESELLDIRSKISYLKNMQLSDDDQKKLDEAAGLPISEICRQYTDRMRSLRQMDYDDQMVYARTILQRCPELMRQLQRHYRYLCVDEAQDTSYIQHEILKLLARQPGSDNLFLVGDEDQSIYGFRAAFPRALLEFRQQHSHARVLLMEDNFRSDAAIVEAANRLIVHNKARHPKTMRAVRPAAAKVRLLPVSRRQDQYAYLLKAAQDCGQNRRPQTAVLYRSNESVLPLVDLLDRKGLPYRIRNSDLSFFNSRVVCDIINIYHFLQDPTDTETFLQIYYKLNLYLPKQTACRICDMCSSGLSRRSPLALLLKDPDTEPYTKSAIRSLIKHREKVLNGSAATALFTIRSTFGYSDYLQRTEGSMNKIAILDILASRESSLESLFRRLDYLREQLQTPRESIHGTSRDTSSLILSTIHASKGLEYSSVYLLDVGDGTFPAMDPPDPDDADAAALYEEERRIFYVGITRARDDLTIFTLPAGSRFADELKHAPQTARRKTSSDVKHAAQSNGADHSDEAVSVFCRRAQKMTPVIHTVYGSGVIRNLTDRRVRVLFDNGEERSFDLHIAVGKGLLQLK
jgi:superfamily I DNA/RNA helicase